MSANDYAAALDRALHHSKQWLDTLPDRRIPARADADEILAALSKPLPEDGAAPDEVVDLLAQHIEPGLTAMGAGRFYGWVTGGVLPAALAADWLTSTWDQNTALRFATPGATAVEEAAGAWLLDLLGLPASAAVGFVTGGTMANFTGLAAGRQQVLADAGWDLDQLGLTGAPRVRVIAGADRHTTIDLALRYLGLGTPTLIAADDQGRIRPSSLADELAAGTGPAIVCLQAGNVHSGAFDPFAEAIEIAHRHGAWVHIDGAFGLWAGASAQLRHLVGGFEGADSWATDAHKTLNVPYDCGVAIVADPQPLQAAMGAQASYLIKSAQGMDPQDKVPEFSRRARGPTVWAALRTLGRRGIAGMVDRFVAHAGALAAGIGQIPGAQILNQVDFTQVCVSFGTDERTRAVTERLLAEGTVWMSGSRWQGRDVLRISVSNWSTSDADVAASLDAVRRAAAG